MFNLFRKKEKDVIQKVSNNIRWKNGGYEIWIRNTFYPRVFQNLGIYLINLHNKITLPKEKILAYYLQEEKISEEKQIEIIKWVKIELKRLEKREQESNKNYKKILKKVKEEWNN